MGESLLNNAFNKAYMQILTEKKNKKLRSSPNVGNIKAGISKSFAAE